MKVVILAGGFGTRLAEYTSLIPKPMVPIGNKPMLVHIMEIYASYGFNEFVIALGYKSEIIKEYFLNYYALNSDFEVDLKNANGEEIRPDIVKIDVEGSEPQVLSCTEFFENTKLILIEIVIDDNFGSNDDVVSKLKSMGFTHIKNTSKNNQLWSR